MNTFNNREIATAIWEHANSELEADRIWESPTKIEQSVILKRAWELADTDETELYWGIERFVK